MSDDALGKKYDSGKARYSLIPPMALLEVAKVLTFGSTKYADYNWKHVDNPEDRYFSATNRHQWAWKMGERTDLESNTHHLANAIVDLMFILELELEKEKNNAI